MPGPRPTAAFAGVSLEVATVPAGTGFQRIFLDRFPDPLGYGKSPSRFSDPRRRVPARRFGVLYLGASAKVCFVETVLRDRRNGAVADFPVEEAELATRKLAEITAASDLSLVDLRGDAPIRMGVPSDVVGASGHGLARAWSVAFHDHPAAPDGIIYPSRLNEETNVAVYGRAVTKLAVVRVRPLLAAPGLAHALNSLRVALV
jgi:hypothetical protein